MAAAAVVIAAAVIAASAVAAVIAVVSVGILREERRFSRTRKVSLTRRPPDLLSARARSVNGVYVRRPNDTGPSQVTRRDTLAS